MKYGNRHKSIKTIARELGVATILEGTVRKAGTDVRITVRMIDAKRDRQLWAEAYDRQLQNVFSIQSEVATRVAETLRVRLLSDERTSIERAPTQNAEAYALYLKGRHYYAERTQDGFEKAMRCFEQAVKIDRGFALGYASMAECSSTSANYGWIAPSDAYSKARRYAAKAFEINPRLAEPHATLGYILAMHEYRWKEAEDEFRKAEELNPSFAPAYHRHSLVLRGMRRFDEAYAKICKAAELDPLSAIIRINVAETLLVLGRTKDAIEQCESVIDANPNNAVAQRVLGWAYLTDSRANQAVAHVKKAEALSGQDPAVKALLASVLGFANRRGEANKIIEELEDLSKDTYVDSVMMAHAFYSVGKVDEAFTYLERGLKERSDLLVEVRWWPWLNELRKNPRWEAIESCMGFSSNLKGSPEGSPVSIEPVRRSEFRNAQSKVLFDFLVQAFIDDYMKKRLYIDQSGWRSLTQISGSSKIPLGALYGRQRSYGPTLNELVSKGLVEHRTFTGQRGRGGTVTKVRVAYDREPTKRYVDRIALP